MTEQPVNVESRDLRDIYLDERARLFSFDLELKLMIVYDEQTNTYECLDDGSKTSVDLVDTIKKRIKEIKASRGVSA